MVDSDSRAGISWLGDLDFPVERMLHGAEGEASAAVLEGVGDQLQPESADETLVVVALVVDEVFEEVLVQVHVGQHLPNLRPLPVFRLVTEMQVQNFVGKVDFAEQLGEGRPEEVVGAEAAVETDVDVAVDFLDGEGAGQLTAEAALEVQFGVAELFLHVVGGNILMSEPAGGGRWGG